ncbi:CDP-diacylglycerol--glycerol-3-phosphate 3-phosphatidyltransferase [Bryobacter aggregatus]|uniref:CDP-diacylglycerol--glycerol-3-phosphate 3-phosphatidyltransferase n=1 Tax=Bryobacter aggregatus TaxID=360054 RepID=UPI00055CE068|nr:CDP-diacylglycerol--glycerol-3-phosphate 3-phosphatidyltransferase [Bryobacter aggregatus]
MNLPNLLTLARIFFVPLVVAALVQERRVYVVDLPGLSFEMGNEMLALAIFLVAALTDMLDGYLARKWRQITTLGMLLDPIADKLLISASLIALVEVKAVPAWMVILIIGRDFAISGLRSIALSEGYLIPASDLGKSKMVLQVAGVGLAMAGLRSPEFHNAGILAMWAAVIFTIVSAIDYARQFWRQIDISTKRRRRRELLLLERTRRRSTRGTVTGG